MRIRILMTVLTLAALVGFSPGCAQTPEQRAAELQKLVDFNNQIHAGIAATTQAAPAIDASIAALPDGKVKADAAKASATVKSELQTAAVLTEGAGKVLVAAQSGDPVAAGAAVGGALSVIPGVGAYAALAGLLVTTAFGVFKSIQSSKATAAAAAADAQAQAHLEAAQTAQTNLKNVVKSIDAAGVVFTDSQKETIKTVQGAETSAVVEQIKAGG